MVPIESIITQQAQSEDGKVLQYLHGNKFETAFEDSEGNLAKIRICRSVLNSLAWVKQLTL